LIAKGADLVAIAPMEMTGFHFATLAMFQRGGERWKRWNEAMKTSLLARQRMEADRDERGSWDPVVGADGGRVEATALAMLDFEVYYRYPRATSLVATPPATPAADGK
jgi:hypothetical protein